MSDRQLGRRKLFIIKIVIGQSGAYIEGNEFKMQCKVPANLFPWKAREALINS
jgi:hypothetical protein